MRPLHQERGTSARRLTQVLAGGSAIDFLPGRARPGQMPGPDSSAFVDRRRPTSRSGSVTLSGSPSATGGVGAQKENGK
jgi:hypothetical protein